MNLIDRYVFAVTRRLPARQRKDIEKEVRAMIDDLIVQRQQTADNQTAGNQAAGNQVHSEKPDAGQQTDQTHIRAVLEELGDPAEMAKQYSGKERYLIGPVLYDSYLLVLKIVLAATGIGLLIANSIKLATETYEHVLTAFWELFGSLYQGLLAAFAMVTLIFMLVEYLNIEEIEKEIIEEKKSWHVDDLPDVPSDKLRIKRGDPIASVIFSLIFLVILNVFPTLFGFYQQTDDGLSIIGFLGEGFARNLVYINIVIVLGIVLEAVKIAYGRWNWLLVASCILQNIFSVIVSLRVIRDDQFINPDFIQAINEFLDKNQVDVRVVWQNSLVTALWILVLIGFVIEVISIAAKGYHLTRQPHNN